MTQLAVVARIDQVDRTQVRWQKDQIAKTLHQLWAARGGALRLPYNVHTHRMLSRLRSTFDRRGWSLRTQTELTRGTVAVWIAQRYRGMRPRRTR